MSFRTNGFLRSVATLTSANILGQLIMLLALPLLTRLYVPDDFGVFAIFTAIMGLVLIVSSLRYELAIPLPTGNRSAGILLALALAINAAIAILSGVLVWFFAARIAAWTGTEAVRGLLWLLPFAILAAGSYKALSFWAVRIQDYNRIGQTKVVQSLANVAAQVSAGVVGSGGGGLVVGHIIGQASGVFRLARGVSVASHLGRAWRSRSKVAVLLKRHRRFPLFDAPASFIDSANMQFAKVAVAVLFGPATAGLYLLAERVLQTPMNLVSKAVAQVLYGSSGAALREGRLHILSRKLVLTLAILLIGPSILLFFMAEPLFVLVFGEGWRGSGTFASVLIVGLAVQFIYSPLSMVLMATEGQGINLIIHSSLVLLKLAVVGVTYSLRDPFIFVFGLALSSALVYGIAVFVILSRAKRYSIGSQRTGAP